MKLAKLTRKLSLLGTIPLVSTLGCGGTSSDDPFGGGDTADAGADAAPRGDAQPDGSGGRSSEGDAGTGGSAAGSGGTTASGGSAGAPGSGGSSGEGSDDCVAPVRKADAALCLTLSPEAMNFESSRGFDGSGVLVVQVFDTPTPPDDMEDEIALYGRAWPPDIENDEILLTELPSPRVVIPDAPATVYVRVFFADNPEVFERDELIAGTWIGGVDVSGGLAEDVPLEPVSVTPGAGRSLDVPLMAFRRLDVSVTASATPAGNGQGPLGVVAVKRQSAVKDAPLFGFVERECVDIADAPLSTSGFLFGSGDFWVAGVLYDYAPTRDLPPGSLSSLRFDLPTETATIPTRIMVAPRAYSVSTEIDLNFLAPFDDDAGVPEDTACGNAPDGGS